MGGTAPNANEYLYPVMNSSVPGPGQDTKNGHGPLLRQFTDNTTTSLIAMFAIAKIEKEKILAQGLENFLERRVWYLLVRKI